MLTAASFQVVKIVGHVVTIINETSCLGAKIERLVAIAPGFAEWASLQPGITRKHMRFVAWCNDMRRARLEDLENIWTKKQRDDYEKLALDAISVIQSTDEALDLVLGEGQPASRNTLQQQCGDLEAFVFLLEVWRYMGSIHKVIIKPHSNAAKWEEQQPLLFYKPPENKIELLWQGAEWAMLKLVDMGRSEWQPILNRHRVWGRGQFAGGTPLDEFLTDPIVSDLRDEIIETFAQILFHLADAVTDLLRTPGVNPADIDSLTVVFDDLNRGLDMQILFTDCMSTWYNTNTSRFLQQSELATLMVGSQPQPLECVSNGLSALWDLEPAMIIGQQHVEAIKLGQVERAEHINPGNVGNPVSAADESTESTVRAVSLRHTSTIAVGQSAAQKALAALDDVLLEADKESGQILTEDDRPSTPPTPEPTTSAQESLAASNLSAVPTEAQQVLDEPAFRFAWGFEEDRYEEDFKPGWHYERAVLKIDLFYAAQTEARRQRTEWKWLLKPEFKKSSRKSSICSDYKKHRAERHRHAPNAPWVSEVPER